MTSRIKNLLIIIFSAIVCAIIFYTLFKKTNTIKEVKYLISNPIINLGEVKQSDASIGVYCIKNIGEQSFTIENIIADCHCTVARWVKEPLPPGEEFELKVTYDNHALGFFEQTVSVYFKEDRSSVPLLILNGTIVSD